MEKTIAETYFFLAHLARTALRAASLLCSAVIDAARAFPPFNPPFRPRATAAAFFFFMAAEYVSAQEKTSCFILRESKERGFVDSTPHYNSIFNYLENPVLRPILTRLIELSALPLASVETEFAADSSGFSTSRFDRWYDHKYGRETFKRSWVKVHLMCGVKTNVVTAVEIAGKDQGDAPMLPALVDKTAEGFAMQEVSADKGYLSAKNVVAIRDAGARPFIAFKKNSTDIGKAGNASKMWRDMYHYFIWRHDDFLASYHKRSNVESTFSMMKRKFGDGLRSKTDVAMVNEALCKILCHNIVVLIHEMFELGIDPVFLNRSNTEAVS